MIAKAATGSSSSRAISPQSSGRRVDIYFSADVETDGPIPGPYSMLSFALVYAGRFDGTTFDQPSAYNETFYRELRPISDEFQPEALAVNGLDRDHLLANGESPETAMTAASEWVKRLAGSCRPVVVAYPLSFDWSWLYWYFTRFSSLGSPFNHSGCFDIKTAYAVKAGVPVSEAGRSSIDSHLLPGDSHTHHALDDAIEQAKIFANLVRWPGPV